MTLLAILTAVLAITARISIGRVAAASGRVDNYYWLLAARAYRTQRGLPVRIPGKYLLEDEEQGYPPLFGMLLGRWHLDRLGIWAVLLLEVAQMAMLAVVMSAFNAPGITVVLALALYGAAPLLVTYNNQLNPRILGDVLLFALMAAEAYAVFLADGAVVILLWGLASMLTALVVMTHKMTLQLYVVLLLPWCWALGSAGPIVAFAGGVLVYVAIVGHGFARYQLRTHREIVQFWNRNWRNLGANQFRDSLVYGRAAACSTRFHQSGMRGVARHVRTVAAYAPVNLALPVASLVTGVWPPAWLLVWISVIYVLALATLFIPQLKCLGGGHLYVFNAIAPGAMYAGWLPDVPLAVGVLGAGVALTAVSLLMAWRIVGSRVTTLDESFDQAVSFLAALPKGRVAVFPLQAAEPVAWATHHAVLWGAHGYGFSRLEGFFPVLTRPLAAHLREHDIDWVLSSDRYWPVGADTLTREGMTPGSETVFGSWHLTECRSARCASA
jgi:hypothetical protein